MKQKRTAYPVVSKALVPALCLSLGLGFLATSGCGKEEPGRKARGGSEQNASRGVQQPPPTQQPSAGTTGQPAAGTAGKPGVKGTPPADHTKDNGGVMHRPGAANDSAICTACHGRDLKGGKVAPSCYSCHDQKWQPSQPPAGATGQPGAKRNPPADHTKNKHDAMHLPGAKRGSATCMPCHGQDLRGGEVAPSCYSCHDQKWK